MAKVFEYNDDTMIILDGTRIMIFAARDNRHERVLDLDLAKEAYDALVLTMAAESEKEIEDDRPDEEDRRTSKVG